MEEDPAVGTVFEEVYKGTKAEAEADYVKLRDLHAKFDGLADAR
jgi:hypothetical protein